MRSRTAFVVWVFLLGLAWPWLRSKRLMWAASAVVCLMPVEVRFLGR